MTIKGSYEASYSEYAYEQVKKSLEAVMPGWRDRFESFSEPAAACAAIQELGRSSPLMVLMRSSGVIEIWRREPREFIGAITTTEDGGQDVKAAAPTLKADPVLTEQVRLLREEFTRTVRILEVCSDAIEMLQGRINAIGSGA